MLGGGESSCPPIRSSGNGFGSIGHRRFPPPAKSTTLRSHPPLLPTATRFERVDETILSRDGQGWIRIEATGARQERAERGALSATLDPARLICTAVALRRASACPSARSSRAIRFVRLCHFFSNLLHPGLVRAAVPALGRGAGC